MVKCLISTAFQCKSVLKFGYRAQYGDPEDFDEWANIIGDQSWSWKEFSRYVFLVPVSFQGRSTDSLVRYFHKFEKYIPDSRYPDVHGKGTSGPMQVGYFTYISDASDTFIKACVNAGIPLSPDFTSNRGTLGVNRIMTYVDKNAQRVSTESAYLTEDVLSRPNLKVAIHAKVTKILFEGSGREIRVSAVEYASTKDGPRYRARVRKEIIMA